MDDNTMKLVDRLLAAERMNAILEAKIKNITDFVWFAERSQAEYCSKHNSSWRNSVDDVEVKTSELRRLLGIDPQRATIDLFNGVDPADEDDE